MNRELLRSSAFIRAAKKFIKKNPQIGSNIQTTLELLSEDAFHPKLRTHKLMGELEGSWACNASFDLRIVFQFVQHEGSEAILLETIGTHEQVY